MLRLVLPLSVGLGLAGLEARIQQPAGVPTLQLLKISSGPAGAERDGVFELTEERAVFSRAEDKEVIVFFQWEGAPGPHKMSATWRSPDGASSTTSTIDYEARDRRFGAYWRLLLAPHTPLGTWSIEATVDGLPGGRYTFEVTDAGAPPAPPVKRILTQRELYERLSRVHVVLERSFASGRSLEPAAALLGPDGRLYTTAAALDEADRIVAFTADGSSTPIEGLLGWSRRDQWAVLAGVPGKVESLEVAALSHVSVGDRCFSMDGTATGGRVLMEGSIIGQSTAADGPPRFVASFATGTPRPGAPVVDESGAFLGVIAGTPNLMEMLRLQASLRGAPILPFRAFRLRDDATPMPLVALRDKGELLGPVVGEEHVRSGGFSVAIQRGPIVAPTDQREEFHVTEDGFTVFVTWHPKERLRGMLTMSLFDADNQLVAQSKPARRDFRKGDLLLTSWQQPVPPVPGRYRADVVMDDRVMWRGYVRVHK
jgi:hypothetical protein